MKPERECGWASAGYDGGYAEANRLNWDERANLHATDPTGSYRIDRVLAGGSSLHAL